MIDDIETELMTISGQLNVLRPENQPELKYDVLSGAVYWSDELPAKALDRPKEYWCLQEVLRYRTTLILNCPDKELESVWNTAKKFFPDWPGFKSNRCQPNAEIAAQYHEFHQRALDDFNSIPD